jgi:hypothetical protein
MLSQITSISFPEIDQNNSDKDSRKEINIAANINNQVNLEKAPDKILLDIKKDTKLIPHKVTITNETKTKIISSMSAIRTLYNCYINESVLPLADFISTTHSLIGMLLSAIDQNDDKPQIFYTRLDLPSLAEDILTNNPCEKKFITCNSMESRAKNICNITNELANDSFIAWIKEHALTFLEKWIPFNLVVGNDEFISINQENLDLPKAKEKIEYLLNNYKKQKNPKLSLMYYPLEFKESKSLDLHAMLIDITLNNNKLYGYIIECEANKTLNSNNIKEEFERLIWHKSKGKVKPYLKILYTGTRVYSPTCMLNCAHFYNLIDNNEEIRETMGNIKNMIGCYKNLTALRDYIINNIPLEFFLLIEEKEVLVQILYKIFASRKESKNGFSQLITSFDNNAKEKMCIFRPSSMSPYLRKKINNIDQLQQATEVDKQLYRNIWEHQNVNIFAQKQLLTYIEKIIVYFSTKPSIKIDHIALMRINQIISLVNKIDINKETSIIQPIKVLSNKIYSFYAKSFFKKINLQLQKINELVNNNQQLLFYINNKAGSNSVNLDIDLTKYKDQILKVNDIYNTVVELYTDANKNYDKNILLQYQKEMKATLDDFFINIGSELKDSLKIQFNEVFYYNKNHLTTDKVILPLLDIQKDINSNIYELENILSTPIKDILPKTISAKYSNSLSRLWGYTSSPKIV